MKNQTCCLTGHRILPPQELAAIQKRLEEELVMLIRQGVRYFGCGGALGFDTLAAQTVLELKKDFEQIKLILVLPCHGQEAFWHASDVRVYEEIKRHADKVVYGTQITSL